MRRHVSDTIAAILFVLALLFAPSSGWTAGGAHIVDDSEVETPGTCHLETWVTRFIPGDGYANFEPACTPARVPWLEIGLAYQHYWDQIIGAPLLGPQAKITIQDDTHGVGIGLGFNAAVNTTTGSLNLGSVIGLVTIPVGKSLRINLNAGWSYLDSDTPHAFFWGGQMEVDMGNDFSLMIEAFGRHPGLIGNQLGVRYTPNNGRFDFDLLVGTTFDDVTTQFITMGVTVRF
jgi:hypothetical protein